jgi:hypothetical protein
MCPHTPPCPAPSAPDREAACNLRYVNIFELFYLPASTLGGLGSVVVLAERLAPAHDPLPLDEAGGLVRALAGGLPADRALAARLSSMLMMASHSSLTTASSFRKWPRALVTLLSQFSDSCCWWCRAACARPG